MHNNTRQTSRARCSVEAKGPRTSSGDGRSQHVTVEPLVRVASLKAAITQLRGQTEANAGRSSQEALAANLVLLRAHGVDDEVLDLVVEMVFAHNLDEGMAAAVNYLASGFLLALMTLEEESARCGGKTALFARSDEGCRRV